MIGHKIPGLPSRIENLDDEQSSVLLLPNTAKQVRKDQITRTSAGTLPCERERRPLREGACGFLGPSRKTGLFRPPRRELVTPVDSCASRGSIRIPRRPRGTPTPVTASPRRFDETGIPSAPRPGRTATLWAPAWCFLNTMPRPRLQERRKGILRNLFGACHRAG